MQLPLLLIYLILFGYILSNCFNVGIASNVLFSIPKIAILAEQVPIIFFVVFSNRKKVLYGIIVDCNVIMRVIPVSIEL